MSKKGKPDYDIGYGKPPQHTRFQKGQPSPWPTGRPRKRKEQPQFPAIDPTQSFIREEARRKIRVRDGDKAEEVATTKAVLRSLGIQAMKGGVLAARTYIQYQREIDAIDRAKREKSFEFWKDFRSDALKKLQRAADRGEPPPRLLPHPDHVVLDYLNLEVQFTGPIDEEDADELAEQKALADLWYELMIFCNETRQGMPSDDRPIFGLFTMLWCIQIKYLPAELRLISEEQSAKLLTRATGYRPWWADYLRTQLQEHGFDLDPAKLRTVLIDLRDLNLRFVRGGFVSYRWPKRKKELPD